METEKFVYWQDGEMWLGYLQEYPDYMTQGETIEELKENLRDIYAELGSGKILCEGIFGETHHQHAKGQLTMV